MRRCTGCGEEKPAEAFWAWQRCWECRRASRRALARERRAAGLVQAKARAIYHDPARGERAKVARHLARWRAKNPEKIRAQHAVENALKRGRLTRQACAVEGCGATAQAHHADYSKPLEVQWLCALHHARQHVAEGRLDHVRAGA